MAVKRFFMESNVGLARWTRIAIVPTTVVTLMMTFLSAIYLYFHQPGVDVEYSSISAVWRMLQFANALSIFFVLVLGVLFCLWLGRAYGNLAGLERKLRLAPAMAVGAWFIPFLNFFQPLLALWDMAEHYCTIALAFPNYPGAQKADAAALRGQITRWFVLFWVAALLSVAGFLLGRFDNSPMHLMTVIANGSRVLPMVFLFPLVARFQALESVAFAAWDKDDYAQWQHSLELSQQQPAQRGKNATWYREAENAQGMMDEIDPFSA